MCCGSEDVAYSLCLEDFQLLENANTKKVKRKSPSYRVKSSTWWVREGGNKKKKIILLDSRVRNEFKTMKC